MKGEVRILIAIMGLVFGCEGDEVLKKSGPKPVSKTNTMKIYMHYMPWYQSKSVSGYWGSHWRMNNKNPEVIDATGKREIASHYYPLIGPYDSQDQDVIEYHLLLMKYAGVDAVLIDWYGTHNVYDYKSVLTGSNALIDKVDDVGLSFAVVYEEYTASNVASQTNKSAIEAAKADVNYLQSQYFGKKEYISINHKPLLLTFGPRYFKQESQWDQIFTSINPKPNFLPLWYHSGSVGKNSNGEYSWIDFTASLNDLQNFYNKGSSIGMMMGSAYPRYHDYYVEGAWGDSYGYVDFNNGETLRNTLTKAQERDIKHLQLVTWNDFGEGTVIEPTREDEFLFLEIIQQFTGVLYTRSELELIHEYYIKKLKYKSDASGMESLKKAFLHLNALEVVSARELINQLQ